MDISKVLVPVDFSPPSILAVNYGITLARKYRARLMLLHVITNEGHKQHQDEKVAAALSMLVGPEDQDDLNLMVLVKRGEVHAQITAAIAECHADVVVMGTSGRRLMGRWLVGSVTESMLRRMLVPVMTVSHAVRPLEFNRILFATDLSEASKTAFTEAIRLAQRMSASLTVVHVLPPALTQAVYDETVDTARAAYRDEARAELERMVATGIDEKVFTDSVLLEGPVADGVFKVADEKMADLITLAVAERGIMDRVVFGSSAERIVREARIPVLSLHVPVMEPVS